MVDNIIIEKDAVHIWIIKIPYSYFSFNYFDKKCDIKMDINEFYFLKEFKSICDSDDILKAFNFYQNKDKIRYLISRYLLKNLLFNYLKISSFKIKFELNAFSKPSINKLMNPNELQFNISHSGEYIAIALSNNDPIGIDVEYIDDKIDMESLKDHFFSTYEKEKWRQLNNLEKHKYFYHVWSCKESILKGIGTGLSYPPVDISFSFDEKGEPKIINAKVCEYENNFDLWTTKMIKNPDNYVGAFSVKKKLFNVSYFDWDWKFYLS